MVVKLKIPPLEDLKALFKEIDEQNKGKKKPTEEEILEEIQANRQREKGKARHLKCLRIVIDTNVFISAIIWQGKPRDLVLKLLRRTHSDICPL